MTAPRPVIFAVLMLATEALTACSSAGLDAITTPDAGPEVGPPPASDAGVVVNVGPGDTGAVDAALPPCAPSVTAEETVLACALPPSLQVLGATSTHVVVLTSPGASSWRLLRVARTGGSVEELGRGIFSLSDVNFVFDPASSTVTHTEHVGVGGSGFTIGLREVNVAADTSRILVQDSVFRPLFSTADHVYFAGDNENHGLFRMARVGQSSFWPTRLSDAWGEPAGRTGGDLYFTQGSGLTGTLVRVPETGGAPTTVAVDVPAARGQVAVDADGSAFAVYPRTEGWGWRVRHLVAGVATDVYECADPELCVSPKSIQVHGAELFLQMGSSLGRIPKAGVPGPQQRGAVAGLGFYVGGDKAPWLEGGRAFYAYSRGGTEGPVEGVVVVRDLGP